MANPYYPIYLDLRGVSCVVVGGGEVALRKVDGLLQAEAQVKVVAPELCTGLNQLAAKGSIQHLPRAYTSGDLAEARLAIAATDQPSVNEAVWHEALERGIWVNVVDDPPHCTFIAPSIVRRGELTIAISTGGRSPALAKRIRQELERAIGPEYEVLLNWLGELRPRAKERWVAKTREALWARLLASEILTLLKAGRTDMARARFDAIVNQTTAQRRSS